MDESLRLHRRSTLLLGLFALCLLCFTVLLYDAQVLHHQEFLNQSETQVTTTQTVETFRGIITDRNGRVLVSNREVYNLTFDPKAVPSEEGVERTVTVARAVLRLLRACRSQGVRWNDGLPITATPPYGYSTATATAAQRSQFQRYLKARGWSDTELTAANPEPMMSRSLQEELHSMGGILPTGTLLALMREDFGLDEGLEEGERMTAEEARLVLGVLYELELRTMDPNVYVPPYVFSEDVSGAFISLLKDGNFAGAVVTSTSVRQYHTDYAAHILGRTGPIYSREELEGLNAAWQKAKDAGEDTAGIHRYTYDDTVGKDGVELAFEDYLRGKDGTRLITTNLEGKITNELYSTKPQPGGTVALTIDIDFQAQVEALLAEAVQKMAEEDKKSEEYDEEKSITRGAGAAVVSVKDSDVLALATYPTYSQRTYLQDLAALNEDPGRPFYNRAVQGTYAPGSTFKPCTAIAGLESGVITPDSRILTRGRYTYYEDYQPACWLWRNGGGTHGNINVSQALYHSCNYFFYEVGRLVGIRTLNEYAAAFGLGQPTGIEISEKTGVLDGPEYRAETGSLWVEGTTIACAIGQADNLFTPLQLANYIATLLRGGERYNAHLLETVTSYDGGEVLFNYETVTADTVEMSEESLQAVKRGMGELVTSGSVSPYFRDCVVSAGAKTGSAQTGEEVANGVFVCFAPFDDPEIAVAIVIEQGGSGAALASTAVGILNAWFTPADIGAVMVPEGVLLP